MKKLKPWQLTKEARAAMHKDLGRLSRRDLEDKYIDQHEQVQRFLRAMKKLGQSITELKLLGL